MNPIDSFIVWHSKKFNGPIRTFFMKVYFFLVRVKNQIKYGDPEIFNYVNIELNRNCNRRCNYCPKNEYAKVMDSKISFKLFKKIIKELEEINYSEKICFTGYYEPLMTKNIVKFISYTRKKLPDSKIIIYTNGDFLTEEMYQKLTKKKIRLIISLHDDPENKNLKRIKKITSKKNTILKKDISNYILSTRGGVVDVEKEEKKSSCIFPSLQLTIDSSGDVILCPDDYFSDYTYGNIKKESLMNIWKSPELKKVRKKTLAGKDLESICKHCLN